jgi:hypothetical protein
MVNSKRILRKLDYFENLHETKPFVRWSGREINAALFLPYLLLKYKSKCFPNYSWKDQDRDGLGLVFYDKNEFGDDTKFREKFQKQESEFSIQLLECIKKCEEDDIIVIPLR